MQRGKASVSEVPVRFMEIGHLPKSKAKASVPD